MLRNYFHVAWRSIIKNPLASFINIFGLAMAIGCGMVAYVFVEWNLDMNQFHEKKDRVFLATMMQNQGGDSQTQQFGGSPLPLSTVLEQDFPQVVGAASLVGQNVTVRYGDNVFNEFIWFSDEDYLNMMTFPLKWGTKEALRSNDQVILSEEMSIKYFGQHNPIGEIITMHFDDKHSLELTVGGVAEKFSDRSSFNFNMLVNVSLLPRVNPEVQMDDWSDIIRATFVELQNPQDAAAVEQGMTSYLATYNTVQDEWNATAFVLEPLETLYEHSNDIRSSVTGSSDPLGRIVLSVMALIIIVLASLNYINIAVSSASKRLKEIGVRKVVGANRSSVILQFLMENVLLTAFALIVGFVLAATLFVPGFDSLFPTGMQFNFFNARLWIFLLLLLLFLSFVSGIYPALVVSKFKPVSIFKGKLKLTGKSTFTKIFLTLQFALSLLAIVAGIVFVQNAKYQKNMDWGYDQEQRITVNVPNFQAYDQLRNELTQNPNILSVVGSSHQIGRSSSINVVEFPDQKLEVRRLDVGEEYPEAMGIRLKDGRYLDEHLQADKQAVLVNETFVKKMGWDNALGQQFRFDSLQYTIVGVVEDFHYYNFWNEIDPVMMRLVPEEEYRYLTLETRPGKAAQTFEFVEQTWKKLFPNEAYRSYFQDESFQDYFNNITGHGKLFTFLAILTIMLSCMGLFGLVSLNVTARMKEFSIRKVLGAGLGEMVKQVNRQFAGVLIIATLLGAPASYFAIKNLLDIVYQYHMPMNTVSVILASAILILVALLTVSSLLRRVLIANPVDGLRDE